MTTNEENIWTAARCNRLLRPINSSIIALRKADSDSKRPREALKNIDVNVRKRTRDSDPIWLPNAKQRKTTYVRKAIITKTPERRGPPKKGKLALPTPLVRRIRSLSEPRLPQIICETTAALAPARKSRQLPIIPISAKADFEHKLLTSFASLMSGTTVAGSSRQTRPRFRPLVQMCLRAIPRLIRLEQAETTTGGESHCSQSYSDDIFSFLEEQFEMTPGSGSPYLRDAVRAHAVDLVSVAVREGLLSESATKGLLHSCILHSAMSDAENIMQAWFQSTAEPSQAQFRELKQFCTAHGRNGFLFRTFRQLLDSDYSQIATVGREHGRLCGILPQFFEDRSEQTPIKAGGNKGFASLESPLRQSRSRRSLHEAAVFLEDCVVPDPRVFLWFHSSSQWTTTIKDLHQTAITMILVALSDSLSIGKTPWKPGIVRDTLHRIAATAILSRDQNLALLRERKHALPKTEQTPCIHGVHSEASKYSGLAAQMNLDIPFIIASVLVFVTAEGVNCAFGALELDALAQYAFVPSTTSSASERAKLHPCTLQFMQQLGESTLCFDRLMDTRLGLSLLPKLLEAAKTGSPMVSALLEAIALEIATRYSSTEQQQGLQHSQWSQDFTEEVLEIMRDGTCQDISGTVTESSRRPKYRWEDGLSEWVTTTPAPSRTAKGANAAHVPIFEDDVPSPDVLAPTPLVDHRAHDRLGRKQNIRSRFASGRARKLTRTSSQNNTKPSRTCGDSSEDELSFYTFS